MNKKLKFLIVFSIILVLLAPSLSLAQSGWNGLVPCGTDRNPESCTFKHFMTLVNKIINFILFTLALPVAAIMFAYAGFSLITAGGGEGKTKAKHIFSSTVIGLVAALAAWLIINTLLTILGYDGDWIGF